MSNNSTDGNDLGFAATQALEPISGPPPGEEETNDATVQMTTESVQAALADLDSKKKPTEDEDDPDSVATALMDEDMVSKVAERLAAEKAAQQQPQAPQVPPTIGGFSVGTGPQQPGMMPGQPGMMPGQMHPGMMPGQMHPGMMQPPARQGRSNGLMIAIGVVAVAIALGVVFLLMFALK